MGEWIDLVASDGHRLQAYVARPEGRPRGAVVVVQEIFGLTGHIRSIVDGYAGEGYVAIAPALFDRVSRGTELAYTDIPTGKSIVEQTPPADTMKDVGAAIAWAKASGRVAVVGFCWGGTLAYLSASAFEIDAAVAYYGGMIAKFTDQTPTAPVLYHFGAEDPYIPQSDVAAIRAAVGSERLHVYEGAGHGFNCDERADYREDAARLARQRSLDFIREHVG